MQLTHSARCLEQGSCSISITVVSLETLSWGSWEPSKAFEKESDAARALHADCFVHLRPDSLYPAIPALFLPSRISLKKEFV